MGPMIYASHHWSAENEKISTGRHKRNGGVVDLLKEALGIAKALEDAGIHYAFCGAIALAIHGYPRATKDIDILIAQDDLQSVRKILASLAYDLEAGIIPFDLGTTKERRIFRTSKAEGRSLITIDLMLVSEVFDRIWQDRELYEINAIQLQVVSRQGLIEMKKIAGRKQDWADIEALESTESNE